MQHTLVHRPPCGAAQNAKARAAYRYWSARADRPAPAPLRPGTGVWAVRTGPDGIPRFVAGHVGAWNILADAYHVVPDDDPLRPFFVGASRVIQRYVGEVAPGVERFCP